MFVFHTDDDMDLEKIAESGQCFRWARTGENAWRIVHGSRCTEIAALGGGDFRLSCGEADYRAVWHDYFDLGEDYRSIRARVHRESDPFLHAACEQGRGIRILRQDFWETLVSFIISQNKNIPAIRRSIGLLCETAGTVKTDEQGRSYRAFPAPEAILALDDDALKACKLGYRCGYVRAAAEAVSGGMLRPERLGGCGAEDAVKALTGIYGVGIKVASCTALFGLHLLDAFPVDVWIRRVLEREYPLGYPLERYQPYNGVYQQYMFYYCRNIIPDQYSL